MLRRDAVSLCLRCAQEFPGVVWTDFLTRRSQAPTAGSYILSRLPASMIIGVDDCIEAGGSLIAQAKASTSAAPYVRRSPCSVPVYHTYATAASKRWATSS